MTDPTPGSDAAIANGCVCPVLDNAHGRGAWGSEGPDAIFIRRQDCTLHGFDLIARHPVGGVRTKEDDRG